MTYVKICGLTNKPDALHAVQAGADFLGFIFAPSSRQITPEAAAQIIAELPATVKKVGVFVNESVEKINEIIKKCHLDYIQLQSMDKIAASVKTLNLVPIDNSEVINLNGGAVAFNNN